MLMTLLNPNYLPKAPSPNIITLVVRAPIYEFWGDTIQFSPQQPSVTFWREYLCEFNDRNVRPDGGGVGKRPY